MARAFAPRSAVSSRRCSRRAHSGVAPVAHESTLRPLPGDRQLGPPVSRRPFFTARQDGQHGAGLAAVGSLERDNSQQPDLARRPPFWELPSPPPPDRRKRPQIRFSTDIQNSAPRALQLSTADGTLDAIVCAQSRTPAARALDVMRCRARKPRAETARP